MSNSPELEQVRSVEERALILLRTKGNPFESLASPTRAAENFGHLHTEKIHETERTLLLDAIDAYRVVEYRQFDQLPRTRVIMILGDRGSGKTHLLQTLMRSEDPNERPKAQLFVRPSTFEPELRFEEYLLAQIRIALGERDEFHLHPPLELIARSLTRRLLLQALRQLSPTQQLFALSPDAILSWGLLWGGADKRIKKWASLLAKLSEPTDAIDIHAAVVGHGLSPEQAVSLVEVHLRRMEASTSPLLIMRRALYTAMARRVIMEDNEALPNFLSEGYRQAGGDSSSRAELVRSLLQVLVEACALCQIPVVLAFDNFERLFAPVGKYDGELARVFFRNIAQMVDLPYGMLILLAFERGLFDSQAAPAMGDEFVQGRLAQRVEIPNNEIPSTIILSSPSPEEILSLISSRVQQHLGVCVGASELPRSFPFAERFPAQLTGAGSVNLRTILLRLRDAYNRIVFQRPEVVRIPVNDPNPISTTMPTPMIPAMVPTVVNPQPNWSEVLEAAWERALHGTPTNASQSTHQEFHECLGVLLQTLGAITVDCWTISKLIPTDPIGEHPSYGVVTRIDWKQTNETSPEGPRELKVGLGFLLAQRRGTLVDLRAKFDYFRKYERGARLVILWPTETPGDLVAGMTEGTRQVWNENRQHHHKTQIRRLNELDLRRLLCLRLLPRHLAEMIDQQVPADLYAEFLRNRLGALLPQLVPPSHSTLE